MQPTAIQKARMAILFFAQTDKGCTTIRECKITKAK